MNAYIHNLQMRAWAIQNNLAGGGFETHDIQTWAKMPPKHIN